MSEHITEIKSRISEEVSHRTYSPLLFFVLVSLAVEHYEIILFLLDSTLNSPEKIIQIEEYWNSNQNLYRPVLRGALIFISWCVIHPISALTWDLIKRIIYWARKNKINKIPIISEYEYEKLQDEHNEKIKQLNREHAEMSLKVESIKSQLESSKRQIKQKENEASRIQNQLSQEKDRLIKSHKDEVSKLNQSFKYELENKNKALEQKENEIDSKHQENKRQNDEILKLKLEIFDKDNWENEASSFLESGFHWRIAFSYLPPTLEEQIKRIFPIEDIHFQNNLSRDFKFLWIKKNEYNPENILYKKGINFVSIRDLQQNMQLFT